MTMFKLRLAHGQMPETQVLLEGPPQVRVREYRLEPQPGGGDQLYLRIGPRQFQIIDATADGREWIAFTEPRGYTGNQARFEVLHDDRDARGTRITWRGGAVLVFQNIALVGLGGVREMDLHLWLPRVSFTWQGPGG